MTLLGCSAVFYAPRRPGRVGARGKMSLWLTMPRLPLYTCALGTGGVLQWSGAAEKAVADFGGPVRASNGAKAAGEGLRVRGGEHS